MIDAVAWDDFCSSALNGAIFHTRRFLGYHEAARWRWDHAAVLGESGRPAALWPAAAADSGATWWSGAGASYGGPVLPADAGANSARFAVDRIVALAAERRYSRIRVTPPPPCYERGERGVVREALLACGFGIVTSEVSQAAPLAGKAPAELLTNPAWRAARKAEREGVVVDSERAYAEFHALLTRDRAAFGARPVHSAAELADLAQRLGEAQALHLARGPKGELVAGSWTLALNDRVALSFYLAQDREQRHLRATNLLQLRALEWAAGRGIRLFDFGTSSISGVVNEGLFTFKERHGGVPFQRETFERSVA
ncbi:MAG: GNAT family N-acetyltransferase [Candidatus Eiseniibacteriota bacterium]